jgi:chloramphenicol-sensitive protein RarD
MASLRVTERARGLIYGVLAYGLWGGVAAFWKLLAHVPPIELLAQRALWGLVAFVVLTALARQLGTLKTALRKPRVVGVMAISGALIAANWGMFVWATNTGHLLEASLGYFITPLVSVAFGTILLREKLSRLQWLAIALATIGVIYLTWRSGRVPWVALLLACTFGLYGLVRKTAKVDALVGSSIETILLVPIAASYIALHGHAHDAPTYALLATSGLVTAIPLVCFTSAARRLPLSTVGFLQYLAPTGQFLLATVAFGEPMSLERLAAFAVIWLGLIVFSIDLWRAARRS